MASKSDFENWLVPIRSEIQQAILQLLITIRTHEKKIKESKYSQIIASLLAGVGFSLWRAVFLAEFDDKSALFESIETFLKTVVRDNAIAYRDDKNVWSFGYYAENARNGQLQVIDVLPPAYRSDLKRFAISLQGQNFFDLTSKAKVELLLKGFKMAIDRYEQMIIGPSLPKLWPEEEGSQTSG